jgi:talin
MSSSQVQQMDTILMASDRLFSSMGDTPEMVKHARILAQATSQLVNALKCEAEGHEDSEQQKKLMAAAKLLADATARMVEAAKGCASAPEDEVQQMALKAAAEELRQATSHTSAGALKRQIFNKLQLAARNVASSGTQLINASSGSGASNRNQASHQQLMGQCKVSSDCLSVHYVVPSAFSDSCCRSYQTKASRNWCRD